MAHKRLKQQSFHDSPPGQSRFSSLPEELKLKVLEYFSSEELHSRFSALPKELKLQILEYIPFEELHPGFSALPRELKLRMLEYFSFEDAARTGILSSTSNWSEQLILDKRLFEKRGRWISLCLTAWVSKVAEILNNHRKGPIPIPIRKFFVHIPNMPFNWDFYINNWIAFLSWNGIEELFLDNCNIIIYELSSFLFECHELTRLVLRNCVFHQSCGGFRNLQFLHLEKIPFGSNIVGAVTISAPLLVWAELIDCTGFLDLDIQAPILKNFVVVATRMSRDEENHLRKLVKPTIRIFDPNYGGSKLGFRLEYYLSPQG